ncbi:ABC transporter ATP-binding protein [Bifidobacterium cebidarum]|uniref:Multidrug ABC transporter ATP-binding protein n=1 Tax=Bifidobacterium cebidarum TaxID=2650773 RepID=A0A6I1GF28_9BIFI|nr:ABC transporter ATP-binding protein [Bifidobacterium cebidarum]KAB7789282.1 multidrug ABC transporter ATP-binding protein [Bifidobacterium cebidarum]
MLTVSHLSKQYAGNPAYSLEDVSFTISNGEIVGLIGKNGAGKTTLMKMMAKAQRQTSGSIVYNGADIFSHDDMLDRFGIMIQPVFVPNISAEDNLRFYLGIHGDTAHERNIRPVLELVDMWRYRNRKPAGFSFGMKQRLALALALVNDPEFLILDEPFVGLDPDGVLQLITVLKQWAAERSIAMLISSHQLNELQELCDRFLFIKSGRLAAEFTGETGEITVIELSRPLTDAERASLIAETLQNSGRSAATIAPDGTSVEIDARSLELNKTIAALASTAGIKAIHDKSTQLNNYFGEGR